MRVHALRVVTEAGAYWVIYRDGRLGDPIAFMSDYEMNDFMEMVQKQKIEAIEARSKN